MEGTESNEPVGILGIRNNHNKGDLQKALDTNTDLADELSRILKLTAKDSPIRSKLFFALGYLQDAERNILECIQILRKEQADNKE